MKYDFLTSPLTYTRDQREQRHDVEYGIAIRGYGHKPNRVKPYEWAIYVLAVVAVVVIWVTR